MARMLEIVGRIARDGDGDASLAALAAIHDFSPTYLQKKFKRFAGESPKQFVQRLRLIRAAGKLRSSDDTILEIALDAGFQSHEVFSRAFRRQFGCLPRDVRKSGRSRSHTAAIADAVVQRSAPCFGLFRVSLSDRKRMGGKKMPQIERRILEEEQPILFIRRRVPQAELQQVMGECYGKLYGHGHVAGLAIAGHPMARYVAIGTGLWTVDLIMPLSAPAETSGEMEAGTLAAGPVAFAIHEGPYDGLPATNAAIERWIEENGHEVGGAPWESFVTDPGETPDPADWRTEIFWPLKA